MGSGEGKENIDATNKHINQIIEIDFYIHPKQEYFF